MKNTQIVLALAVLLGACTGSTVPCSQRPTDPLCQDDSGPPVDMGTDANADAHVACNGMCSGTTPHCLTMGTTETCVGCTAEGDCSGGTPHCDTMGTHTCVACLSDMQCPTAAMAACNATSHGCEACTTSTQCAHLTATPVCVTAGAMMGTCAQCNSNADCTGANMGCDTSTHTCVSYTPASAATCHACVADAECMNAMDRCIPMQFMGMPHGSYCLRQGSSGCMRPFTVPTPARMSVSGAAADMYCGVDETVTTCEAVEALINDTTCTTPNDCGATGIADGRCETVNLVMNRCTYSCGLSSQCPMGSNCGSGYCGS